MKRHTKISLHCFIPAFKQVAFFFCNEVIKWKEEGEKDKCNGLMAVGSREEEDIL